MSLYRQGLSSVSGNPFQKGSLYRQGMTHVGGIGSTLLASVGGPWVSTPGLVADEIAKLNDDVRATDREIYHWLDERGAFPSETTPDDLKVAEGFYEGTWSEFLRSWEDFMTDKSAWYNRLWGYNYGAVQDWRKKLLDLRAAWKNNLGVEFVGPEPAPPKDTEWGLVSLIKNLAIGAVIVIGGFLLVWLIGQMRGSTGVSSQPILIRGK